MGRPVSLPLPAPPRLPLVSHKCPPHSPYVTHTLPEPADTLMLGLSMAGGHHHFPGIPVL